MKLPIEIVWRRMGIAAYVAWVWTLCLFAGASLLYGQNESGSGGKNVRVPRYENGRLKSVFFAENVRQEDDMVAAAGVKVELYEDDGKTVNMVVTLDKCTYDKANEKIESDSGVRLERADMVVAGRGVRWDSAGQKISILADVRVELKGAQWQSRAGMERGMGEDGGKDR